MAYGLAFGLRRSADVAERFDYDGCGERLALVRDEQNRALRYRDLDPRPFPLAGSGVPGVGRVLQQLDEESAVVLMTEEPLTVRE